MKLYFVKREVYGALLLLPFLFLVNCQQKDSPPTTDFTVAETAPPLALIDENWQKSTAVLLGKIINVHDEFNSYSSARMVVTTVYKGPVNIGDTITYLSFREERYPDTMLGQQYDVFLVRKSDQGYTNWATATDLAEFPDNAVTQQLLQNKTN